MRSRFPDGAVAAAALLLVARLCGAAAAPPLRVCADPNNLPYSNAAGGGFENRIAALLAADLGTTLEYTWWAQRRGFVRSTLKAGLCDLVIGVPSAFELLQTTAPYYRSTYVFVTQRERGLDIHGFDDPRLRTLRIGVQLIGDDGANSPPAHALSRRGIIDNVVGYTVYGDYSTPAPTAPIVDAVASGDVDVAVVWGPQAGYFAKHASKPLLLTPVEPAVEQPFLPFVFDMSFGLRRGDNALKDRVEAAARRHRVEIDRILDDYGVPRADLATAAPFAPASAGAAPSAAKEPGT